MAFGSVNMVRNPKESHAEAESPYLYKEDAKNLYLGKEEAEETYMKKDSEESYLGKEEADTRNEAEQMIFATEKALKDLGDKVDNADKEKAEDLVKELKEALEKDDVEDIKKKTEALNETAMSLATKVYEQAQKEQQNNETTEENNDSSKNDKDVMDAEYEEK